MQTKMFKGVFHQCRMAVALAILGTASAQTAWAQDVEADEPGSATGRQSVSVPLSATATEKRIGDLTLSPAVFDTGLVEIGQSTTRLITLTHAGAAGAEPVQISQGSLFGADATEYETDFNGAITLYPGDSQSFQVTFTPAMPGVKSAGLKIELEGATSPYVLLFKGRSRYPLTSSLTQELDALDMGSVVQNQIKKASFTLTNDGEPEAPAINLSDAQITGVDATAFSVNFQPVSVQPGDTVEFQVTLSSGTPGTKSARLDLLHDGSNGTVSIDLQGAVLEPAAVAVGFGKSVLKNSNITRGTSLQFGPDGKLYVSEMDGLIKIFDVTRNGKNNYTSQLVDTITAIRNVPNHDDDGDPKNGLNKRLITGIHVTGSAAAPVIWVASSDPRQGGGPSADNDKKVDTNSGILHKLTKAGGGWNKQDVVRGLPRSAENHAPNGLLMKNGKILLLTGGHTNQGAPSHNFVEIPEYALSAALLEIDVNSINGTYDLPTLDDEDRPGANDANDPFGGNRGKNQAILEANGPVQVFYSGLRNAYDIVETQSGKLYTFDNGPNAGWGGQSLGNCTNEHLNGGATLHDNLHLINKGGYGGHPNPTRGNKGNTFNDSNPQSPIAGAEHPIECDYKKPGQDGSLLSLPSSSNGIDEYTAPNFAGAMQGDLLVAALNKSVYRIELNGAGTQVTSSKQIFTNLGNSPLDITTAGADDPFPGTIWVVDNIAAGIFVFEPNDYESYANN